jgi:hypothetical protein
MLCARTGLPGKPLAKTQVLEGPEGKQAQLELLDEKIRLIKP